MRLKAIAARALGEPVVGAALTVLCGLALWSRVGEWCENASYDYLFRFGARAPTNKVVLILMDNTSYEDFGIGRTDPMAWQRSWHADLLNRLATDGCPLVVFDVFFRPGSTNDASDLKLAEAIRRQGHVVLRGKLSEPEFAGVDAADAVLPNSLLFQAAAGWGIAEVDDSDMIVRRHWQYPRSDTNATSVASLPWAAARLIGKNLTAPSETPWLRYYSETGAWEELSYSRFRDKPAGYFRDKIVFIGSAPETTRLDDRRPDKFGTPSSRWNRIAVGGVKILATTFLNLLNNDWLRRPPWWSEFAAVCTTGVLLGAGMCRIGLCQSFRFGRRIGVVFGIALTVAIVVVCGGVLQAYFTHYWFPWLVIAGGEVPFAFAWTVACAYASNAAAAPVQEPSLMKPTKPYPPPIHGYEYLTNKPFGAGAFGKVWLVRSVIGELNALKIVFHDPFGEESWYGQAEFKGIQKYKPISNNHPGLLHIQHIDIIKESDGSSYFYYVMELGDSLTRDWEKNPDTYVPCNLASLRLQVESQRLPVRKCLEVMLPLAEALAFLHREGLTHRDIKPENIVFVGGCPKLADVGLVTKVRAAEETASRPGTPGYMPPGREPVGTVAADIYALGMVLYVISTGHSPESFPLITTTLAAGSKHEEFMLLDKVIVKATQPDPADRYSSAGEMHAALLHVQAGLGKEPPPEGVAQRP